MIAERSSRWRVGEGEEARLTPGTAAAAEVWSRGFLPLRVRSEGAYRLRPAFPGTAVVLGETAYEVLAEMEFPDDGLVVYRLRPWPDGEAIRDRVVYGPAFVRAAEAERERARVRARAVRWRFLLYPLVGVLPEDVQVRLSDRFGLDAVTATLVSGLAESFGVLLLLTLVGRTTEEGAAVMLIVSLPGLILLVLPGLGRAFGALFLRETGGSAPVVFLFETLRLLGAARPRHDPSFVPLTRSAFWERLRRPDAVERREDGTLVFRGLLPHITWARGRRLLAGNRYWEVSAESPVLDRGRLVHTYHLVLLGEPPGEAEPPPPAPSPSAYAEEVLVEVRREWDDWNLGFAWYTTLLAADIQARAFDHRGGPASVRRATLASAIALLLLGLYILARLPGGPAADPLAPLLALLAVTMVVDAGSRIRASGRGRYAPSLLRWFLPSDVLRPERLAYHAHRDAERAALDALGPPSPDPAQGA